MGDGTLNVVKITMINTIGKIGIVIAMICTVAQKSSVTYFKMFRTKDHTNKAFLMLQDVLE